MSADPNPIILTFYQAILIPAFQAIQKAWVMKDYEGAFNNVKFLYGVLPNVCQNECEEEYVKALRTVNAIEDGYKELDIITRRTKIGISTRNFLYSETLRLVGVFKQSLDTHRYLEKAGVKPRVGGIGKL